VQTRSPARPSACRVGHDAELVNVPHDRDDPQQLGGWRTLPTAHTGADGERATYHR